MRFDIAFNGASGWENGILPVQRPSIQPSARDMEFLEIPGRSGILTIDNKRYEPLIIPVEFNFRSAEGEWNETFRNAKRWLSGGGRLEFTDDADYFYKVYSVKLKSVERKTKRIAKFTAEFTCDPFSYLKDGERVYSKEEVEFNPYYISHPYYLITGEGVCVLTVNGKSMRANIGQNLTINTELMIAYRLDGTMQNTAVTGDYQDMYLEEGDNQISVSSGFALKVIPNWRSL